jgi:heme O synthase-like polyprenyltransferase
MPWAKEGLFRYRHNQPPRVVVSVKNGFLNQALTLARTSNLPTVWTNCLAAWGINALAAASLRGMPPWGELGTLDPNCLFFLLLGASLVYAGGCTLNDAFDEKFDHRYNPERPLPSGRISRGTVWGLGLIELGVGASLLILGAKCSALWILLLILSVVTYDYLHKKWAGGFVLMGGCRLFLWLAAASAGGMNAIAPQTWIWGLALFVYVMGISLFARGESQKQEAPARLAILFLFSSPLLALAGLTYWHQIDPIRQTLINLTGLLVAWIAFRSIQEMRSSRDGAIGEGVSRLLAGICAVDAVAVSFYLPALVVPSLCCVSLAHLLQKRFAAT